MNNVNIFLVSFFLTFGSMYIDNNIVVEPNEIYKTESRVLVARRSDWYD